VAITDFYLFEWMKDQLSGRILDREQNLGEMITEILLLLSKDEVKNAFQDVGEWWTRMESSVFAMGMPRSLNIVSNVILKTSGTLCNPYI
jgi:hypothetical protein